MTPFRGRKNMATDKNGNVLVPNDGVVLRLTVVDVKDPEPDPILGEPHADACSVVTATLDPKDPHSPRFVFRADQLEKLS